MDPLPSSSPPALPSPNLQPSARCEPLSGQESSNSTQNSARISLTSPPPSPQSVLPLQEPPIPAPESSLSSPGQSSSCSDHAHEVSLPDKIPDSVERSCDRLDSLPLRSSDDVDHTRLDAAQHQASQEQRFSCPSSEDAPDLPSLNQHEQQQPRQPLTRISSLNAQAREFVPKSVATPGGPPAALAVTPPSIHGPISPPLRMPHGSSPTGLPSFTPSSPVARTPPPQLGMFPPSGIGPPPPPIPGCVTTPMKMLCPPHALLNMQLHRSSPSQSILPPTFMMPSSPLGVTIHPQSAHVPDSHVAQSFGANAKSVQDGDQSHELTSSSVPPSAAKPVLNEDMKTKIIKQVEFYFSDSNLPTDNFLLKCVRDDPEGFVPMSVLATFRKMKYLVKNSATLATALRGSEQLVVSDDGKKVRRLQPLPDVDVEVQSRTVVAENLPEDHSDSSIEKLFQSVGNVKTVKVCQPEAVNGANQTFANFMKSDMVVSNKLHALIEYETMEQAERAVSELTDHRNWRSGLHVRLLLRRTFQSRHGHQQVVGGRGCTSNDGGDGSGGEDDATPLSDTGFEKVGEESLDGAVGYENAYSEKDGGLRRGRGRGRGRSKHGHFHQNGGRTHPPVTFVHANVVTNSEAKPPPGPRMPDGTRGFSAGRGKLIVNT